MTIFKLFEKKYLKKKLKISWLDTCSIRTRC